MRECIQLFCVAAVGLKTAEQKRVANPRRPNNELNEWS